uniref:Uncharacterized protein n=1 Tax=Chromera velia CCMP2878 TaxID=1169474 RepID=A0A0G4GQW3_9ALVE|eukprot:Cvel_22970.t1-p1 / transcript=Cvel_22970.t1 / gene=Cvel_22970 / organism=Chromera_velia_CCMP2878 / gene_product=hypothetical protein / transcript_product=hypothetical protein / location=Cvel_scaffold2315:8241-12660(-) / protein_length=684 / sequence_SO=supercontig / SO=protein_coding / is_pseudo=false
MHSLLASGCVRCAHRRIPSSLSLRRLWRRQVSSVADRLPQQFAFAQSAFTEIENLSRSLAFVRAHFPPFSSGSEPLWRLYASELLKGGVVEAHHMEEVAEVLSSKGFSVLSFWDKFFASVSPLVESAGALSLLSLAESLRKIGHRDENLLERLVSVWRDGVLQMPKPDVARLVTCLAGLRTSNTRLLGEIVELVIEEGPEFESSDLIDIVHSFALLEVRDEDLLRCAGRVLHPRLERLELTPLEAVKLARAYALLQWEHITFFKTLSTHAIANWRSFMMAVAIGETDSAAQILRVPNRTAEAPPVVKVRESVSQQVRHLTETATSFDDLFREPDYQEGFGRPRDFVRMTPSEKSAIASREGGELGQENTRETGGAEDTAATYETAQPQMSEMTAGQVAMLADSLQLLKFDSFAPYFSDLASVLLGRLEDPLALLTLDPQQLCAVMLTVARLHRGEKRFLPLVELSTRRMFWMFSCHIAKPHTFALFLKNLAIWRWYGTQVKRRGKNFRVAEALSIDFLKESRVVTEDLLVPDETAEEPEDVAEIVRMGVTKASLLERMGQTVCARVYEFELPSLCSALRSMAYLDFTEEAFFSAFVEYLKERTPEMASRDIKNLRDAFNKARRHEAHLFNLMGKRWQDIQQSSLTIKHRGSVVPRTGSALDRPPESFQHPSTGAVPPPRIQTIG